MIYETVRWKMADDRICAEFAGNKGLMPGKLRLIDQTLLPEKLEYVESDDIAEIHSFIKRLVVRGAPAIGAAAALGLAAAMQKSGADSRESFMCELRRSADYLASSRPTAVNLFWALGRCVDALKKSDADSPDTLKEKLLEEAFSILNEDMLLCENIGKNGATLLKDGMTVLTHCNAGALATCGIGTALAPIYIAHSRGLKIKVYADETRPLLQGARLTAWELDKAGIDVTVICDNMAGFLMGKGRIDLVITGADRIAANGDSANKIGTYSLAVLARHHKVPFYIAAPYSTIDMNINDGTAIPIEERAGEEISRSFGKQTAPPTVKIFNPAFDVTPHELISGIITEKGLILPPYKDGLKRYGLQLL